MAGIGVQQTNTGSAVQQVSGSPDAVVLGGASFTRPADTTAYASGDLVANSTTAGSVSPLSLTVAPVNNGTGVIRRVWLQKSGTSLTNASFRVHLYAQSTAITCANGDNSAWSTNSVAGYIGSYDVTMDRAFTDGAKGFGLPSIGQELFFAAPNGTRAILALLEARAAYTPASAEVFTLTAEVWS
jgi:hypothetical protein